MRRIAFTSWLAIIVALVAVATAEAFTGPAPQTMNDAAGVLVNKPIHIECQDDLPFAGQAMADDSLPIGNVWLNGDYCRPWTDPWFMGQDDVIGSALITLAHEAKHTRGIKNEAYVECWALQKTDDLARIFGFPEKRIPRIMYWAKKDHNELVGQVPQYRNNRKCRPGGAWDVEPGDHRWP